MIRRKWGNRKRISLTAVMLAMMLFAAGCHGSSAEEAAKAQPAASDMPGEQLARLQALDETSQRLYTAAKEGKPEEAIKYLESISIQMTRTSFDGATSLGGVEAMAAAVLDAQKTFTAVKADPREWLLKATAVRLAADALTHKHQPMWHQFDDLMMQDATALNGAAAKRESTNVKQALRRFEEHYSTVRPAMVISLAPQLIEEADSMFRYLHAKTDLQVPEFAAIFDQREAIRVLLGKLFAKHHADQTAYAAVHPTHSWIYWSTGIGSVILTVLGFAAYKRFQFERNHIRTYRRRERG